MTPLNKDMNKIIKSEIGNCLANFGIQGEKHSDLLKALVLTLDSVEQPKPSCVCPCHQSGIRAVIAHYEDHSVICPHCSPTQTKECKHKNSWKDGCRHFCPDCGKQVQWMDEGYWSDQIPPPKPSEWECEHDKPLRLCSACIVAEYCRPPEPLRQDSDDELTETFKRINPSVFVQDSPLSLNRKIKEALNHILAYLRSKE